MHTGNCFRQIIFIIPLILITLSCKKDIIIDKSADDYTGTWVFTHKNEISESQSGYYSLYGPYTFTGFIRKDSHTGYLTIVYTGNFDSLTKKVEADGRILNTCGTPAYPGECSGYFTDDDNFFYKSFYVNYKTAPYPRTFTMTLEGKKISKTIDVYKAPYAFSLDAQNISSDGAVLCGTVNPNFLNTTVSFEYGVTSDYGSFVTADPSSILNGKDQYVGANIKDLIPEKTYHFRVKAVNSMGTTYGSDMTFFTSSSSTTVITDVDGNSYRTIKIGSQTWLAENLKVTRLNDNETIPEIIDVDTWALMTSPAYCWHSNDKINSEVYGALYNWHSVNTGKLCPAGWHVPSFQEWNTLIEYIGGSEVAGSKLKEAGTDFWVQSQHGAGTNSTGFSALPGGKRVDSNPNYSNGYDKTGYTGYWWSSTENEAGMPNGVFLNFSSAYTSSFAYAKFVGCSVRCIKD